MRKGEFYMDIRYNAEQIFIKVAKNNHKRIWKEKKSDLNMWICDRTCCALTLDMVLMHFNIYQEVCAEQGVYITQSKKYIHYRVDKPSRWSVWKSKVTGK